MIPWCEKKHKPDILSPFKLICCTLHQQLTEKHCFQLNFTPEGNTGLRSPYITVPIVRLLLIGWF